MSLAEYLVGFCEVVAADTALVKGLKHKGPHSWCPQRKSDVAQLEQDLKNLTVSRSLPIKTIRAVQRAFALTQASLVTHVLVFYTVAQHFIRKVDSWDSACYGSPQCAAHKGS